MEELYRQLLDDEELYRFRAGVRRLSLRERYHTESWQEKWRLRFTRQERDQNGQHSYRGLDLSGRAGTQRGGVMIRHAIQQRWDQLHVWGPTWGIPDRMNPGPNDDTSMWHWPWDESHPLP
jgi:hypothetical protein